MAFLSVMLRDNDIDVCCDADAEEDGDDPPQREIADQDMEHRDPGNAPRCAAASGWLVRADSAHAGVVSPRRVARGALITNSAFQFFGG